MRIAGCVASIATLFTFSACTTFAAEEDEWRPEVLLHSDVPLWTENSGANVSPRPMGDAIGCDGELVTGDWRQTYEPDEEGVAPDPVWWRVHSYGSFHCAAVFAWGGERGEYEGDDFGFFIRLGHDSASGLDLFAWEIGLRPGSIYVLLAAPAASDLTRFSVLDVDCSAGQTRKSEFSSSWVTEYCAIPDQKALLATARTAAKKLPLGTLEHVDPTSAE